MTLIPRTRLICRMIALLSSQSYLSNLFCAVVHCFYVFVVDEWLVHRRLLCSSLFSVQSSINNDKGEGDMTRNAPYCHFPLPYCSIVRRVQYYSYFLHLPH
jgi:hypothetical protein